MNREQRIFQPSLFREYLRSKLISLLDSIAGRKLLMLEPAVRTPINLIAQKKMFGEHGVADQGGIVSFQPMILDQNYDQVLIFLSPTAHNLKVLKKLISVNQQKGNKKYYPCFWPKRTIACKQFLQSQELMPFVQIRDFSFDLLPLDIDLYSLEIKSIRSLYIDNNYSIYTTVAESIHRLQCVFGKIHNIFGKGKAARAVFEILKLKEKEIKIDENYGDIEHLIILDRAIDFATPLLKQITYEGLIDEVFGINGMITKVPSNLFDDAPKEKKSESAYKNIQVNSEKDYIYEQIRILTINGARSCLKNKGADFDNFREESKRLQDINEKAAATKRIQAEREYLTKHLNLNSILMEEIKTIAFHKELLLQQRCLLEKEKDIVDYFVNMIPFDIPLEKILRSMCLQCIIDKGINKKLQYGKICDDIVMTYGIEHVISLTNLANLGLFYDQSANKDVYRFTEVKKELKLISDTPINHENPQDPSFAYGGYTPILTKLVEGAIKGSWKTMSKGIQMLPGEVIMPSNYRECNSHPRPVVLIYVVGGVTYGEVATMRLLGRFLNKQIVIATTEIINGETFIRQLIE